MRTSLAIAALGAVLPLLFSGCSGSSTPTQPVGDPSSAPVPSAANVAPGTGLSGILGVVKFTVSDFGQTIAAEPVRETSATLGDSWTLDATQFFTNSPCDDCLKITGFGLVGDDLLMDVELRHPFPSVLNRTDLDVFDPRVILVTEAREEWNYTDFPMVTYLRPSIAGPLPTAIGANTTIMLNADGYTTHFDEAIDAVAGRILGGNLNPFVEYGIDLIPNDPFSGENPQHRLYQTRLAETQQFQINLPPTVETFEAYLVFECNYGASANKFTRFNPQYYVPEFNRKEAIDVRMEVNGPFAGLTYGSTIDIEVGASDWQQSVTVDTLYPQPANRDQLKQMSNMARMNVAIPGWSLAATTINAPTAIGASPPIRFVYNATLSRNTPLPPQPGAVLPVLVQVEDSLHNLPNYITEPGFNLGQTFDVSTYQISQVQVDYNAGAPFLDAASPALLLADTGLDIRTAPYIGSLNGNARFGTYYDRGEVTGPFSVRPSELRLLFADSGGAFSSFDPSTGFSRPDSFPGAHPLDDYPDSPEAHPDPENTMVVRSLEMAASGDFFASFGDNNFTVDPLRFNTGITDRSSNSAICGTWNRSDQGLFTQSFYLADGCGSAPGPSPGIKVRQIMHSTVLGGNDFGRWTDLLGFVSAGQDTEACGDVALIEYFGAPYSASTDRALRVDGTAIAIAAMAGPIDDTNGDRFGRMVSGRLVNNARWPHFLPVDTLLTQIVIFDALEGFDPILRESTPTSTTIIPGLLGANSVDLAFIPYDAAAPFGIGGVVQTHDWLVALYRQTLGNTYVLEAYDANQLVAGSKVVDATSAGAGTWGNAVPVINAMRYDPVNHYLLLSYDSNGVTPGGDIQVTVLAPQ